MTPPRSFAPLAVLITGLCCLSPTGATGDEIAVEFFERSVRPILVEKCTSCHGPDKQESGLRLDRREDALRGGVSGAAIAPGQPKRSLLWQAITGQNDLQMPPEDKLSPREIKTLTRWIEAGAVWPATSDHADGPDRENHWAFQPLLPIDPATLPVSDQAAEWSSNPIDLFIWHRQQSHGLTPAAEADPRTLLRRLTLKLTGLPPTNTEMSQFLADPRPDRYQRAVQRLLASPRYGEKWGRHWLDVARYADNKGYVFFEDKNFPWAWTYRDYVIRAFNRDLPYDRFIVEQLAAEQLDLGDDRSALAAMGFLTAGARFTNNTHDVIDDRIDVVTRGLMGLTVTCARCHDHKFDPIPQADYYSLYSVFRSSMEPTLGPLLRPAPDTDAYREFQTGLQQRVDKLHQFVDQQRERLMKGSRERVTEYLLAVHRKRNHPSTENFMLLTDKGALIPAMIHRWEVYLKRAARRRDPRWVVWESFSALDAQLHAADLDAPVESTDFAEQAAATQADLLSLPTDKIHPLIRARLADQRFESIDDVARMYGELLTEIDQKWQAAVAMEMPPTHLEDPAEESLRQIFYGPGSPAVVPRELSWGFLDLLPDRPTQGEFKELIKAVEQFSTKESAAPPRAMVLVDVDPPYQGVIFQRGNPNREGEPVPRQFLKVLSPEERQPYQSGSGRLELAQQIASPDNPLTARVIVNRLWRHHFGRGLVETPSDFGLQGDRPSHPQLLDWLAGELIRSGWSLKHLQRLIVTSSTYRQASTVSAAQRRVADQIDPENRWISRFRRQRLDFESVRDSMLSVTGQLDTTIGGPPQTLMDVNVPRRSVYGFIDRMDLPNLLRAFDFPDPSSTNPKRDQTTIPTQGLFFMNHPYVLHAARAMERHPEVRSSDNVDDRIRAIFRLVLAREPTQDELRMAQEFVGLDRQQPVASPWLYGYGSVPEAAERVVSFVELSFWTGSRWQASSQLPDPQVGWVFVDSEGGHPAATYDRCVIRRWVSPVDGTVRLTGTLQHVPEQGNGVRARIFSSRHGQLGSWTAFHSSAATDLAAVDVQVGDTIDMVVDYQGQITHDEHLWHVHIDHSAGKAWDSRDDFRGGETNRWQMLVQALLMTNEFVYVD